MLDLNNISLKLGTFSLKDITFRVNKGDYFVLVGVSGAGKSLILESIAGLIIPANGSVSLNGRDITHEKINKRSVGLVFQDHAVFPHMSVRQNLAYSLHSRAIGKNEKEKLIKEIAKKLEITALLDRRPGTLSGGELQRVSLARTLIQQPEILLLDEPLASLDVQLRSELRSFLRKLNASGQTIIHVTHDYNEAVSLATRIAVVHNGSIIQVGTPGDIFTKPASAFAAKLSGIQNFYSARLVQTNPARVLVENKITLNASDPCCLIHPVKPGNKEGFLIIPNEAVTIENIQDQNIDKDEASSKLKDEKVSSTNYLSEVASPTSKNSAPVINTLPGIITDLIKTIYTTEITVEAGIRITVVLPNETIEKLHLKEGKKILVRIAL